MFKQIIKKIPFVFSIILLSSCSQEDCLPTQKKGRKSYSKIFISDSSNSTNVSLNDYFPSSPIPTASVINGYAWTFSGTPLRVRTAFKIDISEIPQNATITKATLSLYLYEKPADVGFTKISAKNDASIYKITQEWDPQTTTWNNQPTISLDQKIILDSTQTLNKDYSNLEITNLVSDSEGKLLPNFGWELRLNTEQYYRNISFGSATCPDVTKRPKLEIEYSVLE